MKTAGIYIHIPFCERKCTYCNFNTTDYFDGLAQRYIAAVENEIVYLGERAQEQRLNRIAVDTIYFGGGTPSIVEAEQLERLIERARAAFDVSPTAEITIEINPATFSPEKIKGWLKSGINRASIGLQSLIDSELVALSRTHTASEARQTFYGLRQSGFDNISVDLIAGLPGQTLDDWRFNLSEALKLRPEHLSLYLLEIKEGTQLYAQLKRGKQPYPDDDTAADMYRMIARMTRDAGYEHYEISNFALASDGRANEKNAFSPFRSQHNMKYWTGAPFYGLGCGAHSYDGRARWINLMQTEKYIAAVNQTGQAVGERRDLDPDELAAEALFMGLRLEEGIDLDQFRTFYGIDVIERYGDQLPRLQEAGLIDVNYERLKLTDRGRLLSNEVFVSFV